jgi:hypothetical protein
MERRQCALSRNFMSNVSEFTSPNDVPLRQKRNSALGAEAAIALWGARPTLGSKWCGFWRYTGRTAVKVRL